MTAFITLLHKELSSDYGVDFFGCVMAGQTLKEERKAAYEILSLHIEGMLEDGDAIPKPASLDDIIKDLDNQEAVTFLVDIPLSCSSGDGEIGFMKMLYNLLLYI